MVVQIEVLKIVILIIIFFFRRPEAVKNEALGIYVDILPIVPAVAFFSRLVLVMESFFVALFNNATMIFIIEFG